jgi:hypothetical protein
MGAACGLTSAFDTGFAAVLATAPAPAAGAAAPGLVLLARLAAAEPADAFMVDTSDPSRCTILTAASTTAGKRDRKNVRRADGSAGLE